MKKLITTFLLLFLLMGAYYAKAQFFEAGIRAGLNYPSVVGIEGTAYSGFHAGTYFKFNPLGILAFEPGIQYSQKGFRSPASSPIGHASDRMHYLDVPVLVRLSVLPLVNIFAGPQASYLLARNFDGDVSYTHTNNLRDYDVSGVAGVGINLPLGFNIQGSYEFGITSINYDGTDTRHNVVKISLGKSF
jgi:hypothetical protein